MKIAEDAARELPLKVELVEVNEVFHKDLVPPPEKKHSRHVLVALNHLHKRRDTLLAARQKINDELDEILESIQALG